eukprot:s758_g17.t1
MAKVESWQFPNAVGSLRLCFGMTLLFTAFQEVQNAAPLNITEVGLGNFGFYALATFYGGMLFGNQVAPRIIQRVGGRTSLPIAALGYLFFIGSLLVVSHISVVRGSSVVVVVLVSIAALSGLLGGLLWPSQGYVLTHYAPQHLLNWYMSMFSLSFFASGFLGPAVVAPVIDFAGQHSIAVPLTLLTLAILGVLLLCRLPASDQAHTSVSSTSSLSLKLLFEAPARRLAFLSFAEGWCLNAYVPAMLPIMASRWTSTSFHSEHEHFQLTLLLNGLGHIFASLFYAPMADRFGRRFMLLFQAAMALVALMLAELDLSLDEAVLDLSAAFFLGFSTILARTNNNAICGNLYRERAGSAFALLATLRGLGSIAGMLAMPSISGSWSREIVAASLGCLCAASLCAAAHMPLFVTSAPGSNLDLEPCEA